MPALYGPGLRRALPRKSCPAVACSCRSPPRACNNRAQGPLMDQPRYPRSHNVDCHPRRARARARFRPGFEQQCWPGHPSWMRPACACSMKPLSTSASPSATATGRLPDRLWQRQPARQQQFRLVQAAAGRPVLLYRPHRGRQPPSWRRRRPCVLCRRAELRRAALPADDLRSLPRPWRRCRPALPRQLRLPRAGPEHDAAGRCARQHAGQELCSYPWVRETYGGKLPDVAWTRARQLPAQAQRPTGT